MLQNRSSPLVHSPNRLIFCLNYMLFSSTIWSPEKSISSIGRLPASRGAVLSDFRDGSQQSMHEPADWGHLVYEGGKAKLSTNKRLDVRWKEPKMIRVLSGIFW